METIQRMRAIDDGPVKSKRTKSSIKSSVGASADRLTLHAIQQLSTNAALPILVTDTTTKPSKTSRKMISNGKKQPPQKQPPQQRLWFESPRLELEDHQVFSHKSELLTDPDQRWKKMREQAGSHQQDGSVLRLRPHIHTPQVLKHGMPPKAAGRVQELHVQVAEDGLPTWMDAITTTFENLQHLYVTQLPEEEETDQENEVQQSVQRTSLATKSNPGQSASRNNVAWQEDSEKDEAQKAAEHSDRLKRLYILYRLPDLVSIDGVRVSAVERRLARPDSPNGEKVDRKEWVSTDNHSSEVCIFLEDSAVEIDMYMQDAPVTPAHHRGLEECFSNVTHREKAVEVDLDGDMLEVELAYENSTKTPRIRAQQTTPTFQEKKRELDPREVSCVDRSSFQCSPLVLRDDNHSATTDDCAWSAACGGLAMWRNSTNAKQLSSDMSQRAKNNFRQSSSWKECQARLAAARIAAGPYGSRRNSVSSTQKITSRSESSDLSEKKKTSSRTKVDSDAIGNSETTFSSREEEPSVAPTTKSLSSDRLGPIEFVDSNDNEMITRNVTPRRTPSLLAKFRRTSSFPRSPTATQGQRTTIPIAKRRMPASKSLSSPFPMQFREKVAMPSPSNVTLQVHTAAAPEGNTRVTPPPMPPPPPTSSRQAKSLDGTTVIERETIEFSFPGGPTSPMTLSASLSSTRSAKQTSPVASSNMPAKLDKSSLPPPGPPNSNPPKRRSKPKQNKKNKRHGLLEKWKEHNSARSMSSIIDGEDDEEDIEVCTETASSGSSSRDEDLLCSEDED